MLNSRLVFTRGQGGEGRERKLFSEQEEALATAVRTSWWCQEYLLVLLLIHSLFREYLFIRDNVAGNVLGAEDTGAARETSIFAVRDGKGKQLLWSYKRWVLTLNRMLVGTEQGE